MSIIIDTTKSELEEVIRYARYGANNCMISNSWELTELVRCKDCQYWEQATPNSGNCNRAFEITAYANDYCSYGERRSE